MREKPVVAVVVVAMLAVLVALLLPGCGDHKQADDRPAHDHLAGVATSRTSTG